MDRNFIEGEDEELVEEDELDYDNEDIEDEEQDGPYYECPFCNEKIYDPFGCSHTVYIWDAVNFEVSYINDELEQILTNIIKNDPQKWIEDYKDYEEYDFDQDFRFEKIVDPDKIQNIIFSKEASAILPSFIMEEAADTDHRSYYIGKFFGLSEEIEIEELKDYINKSNNN